MLLFGHRYSIGPQRFRQIILSHSSKAQSSASSKPGSAGSKTLLVEYVSMLAQHTHAPGRSGVKAGKQQNESNNSQKNYE